MGIGISVVLLVIGAILLTGAVDLPTSVTDHVQADLVGWICIGVGVLGIVVGLLAGRRGTNPPA
ncbi:MAG: hypothetical protein ACR2K3_08605 [Nocardioides sp.]